MRHQLQRIAVGTLLAVLVAVSSGQVGGASDATDLISLYGGPVHVWQRVFAFQPFWRYVGGAPFALTSLAMRWAAASATDAPAEADQTVAAMAPPADTPSVPTSRGTTDPTTQQGNDLTYHMLWWQMALDANKLAKTLPKPAPEPPAPPKPAPEPPAPPKPAPEPPAPPKPAPEPPAPPKPAPEPPAPPKPAPEPPVPPKPAPEPPAPPKSAPAPVDGLTAEEQAMVDLINAERTNAGLPALQAIRELAEVARRKSADMVENGYFSHDSPTYGSPFEMLKQFGITYKAAGENLAGNRSVEAAHKALMNSPGHRANILNASYTHIGIGIQESSKYGLVVTQLFVGR